MTIDYQKLGLKCGLEIHQQLDSHKLFCDCPSILRKDEPELRVYRRLHAVAGEGGEVDVAAIYEAGKDNEFVYEAFDTTCLVELDESPPHLINQEALQIALHISLLLNCKIVPIAQIMRKTVVNGSNTSGFQRTVLIARDGFLETESGKVGITAVYLEEDAAREMGVDAGKKIYRLDRLGIPLVEIVTAPDIKSAEHCKEVALSIGDVLRSCKVKRGIGTIRQDINISIANHPRAEIKGFQEPKIFVDVVDKEIERQKKEIDENKLGLAPEVRNANPDASTSFLRPLPGSSRMYPETDLPLLKISREIINIAKDCLPKLRSERKEEWRKQGLSDEMIKLLSKGDKVEEFEYLNQILKEPNFIAKLLFIFPREIASHENLQNIDEILSLDIIESILQAVCKGIIKQEDAKHVMTEIAKGKKFEEAIKIEKIDVSDVEQEIAKIVKEKPGLSIGAYMGLVMAKFKGKISGKEASLVLAKLVK